MIVSASPPVMESETMMRIPTASVPMTVSPST